MVIKDAYGAERVSSAWEGEIAKVMGKVYEVRLVGNCSEINGTLIRIPSLATETTAHPGNSTFGDDSYDHQGAMQFIIATVLVYSICGVLCTLINRMKRLRGKSHQAYMQDENVQRYLKSEKVLKLDGRRTKMQYDCEMISETVNRFEDKQKLRELEREIGSGDFVQAHEQNETKKNRGKKKRKARDVGGALGQMGLSLFYIQAGDKSNNNIEDFGLATSADEAATACKGMEHVFIDSKNDITDTINDTAEDGLSSDARQLLETAIDINQEDIVYIDV